MRTLVLLLAIAGALPFAAGCRSVYYDVWETFGKEKRDLLRTELRGMMSDQREAEKAFGTALDRMKQLTRFEGGALEEQYDRLKSAHADAASAAGDIDDRMDDIHNVAADLFSEWEAEIATMTTPALRDASRRQLTETRHRYTNLDRNLNATRATMTPVLGFLRDHVLYLKHNLNAQAIGALGNEMGSVERDIENLRASIQLSIDEAQRFIASMQ